MLGPAAGTQGASAGEHSPAWPDAHTRWHQPRRGDFAQVLCSPLGPWPVTEGMLALGPSPVRAGSPRTGRPPPLVLPVPTETGPCPRAWLTGRSAHTCVRLCAAPRAGWLRVPASLLRSLPLSPVSPRTRVTPGRPLRSCDTDAQRGNSAGPNLNPSPQVQALPDPGWDQRPSSPD